MITLPFFFERLQGDKTFISNIGGFNTVIDSDSLNHLIFNTQSLGGKIKQELMFKGFLSDHESHTVTITALASSYAKRLSAEIKFRPVFMIVPTLRCDHTCSYCQVSRAPINQKNYDMSESDLELAVEKIRELSTPPYNIEVQGGEPLLRFDLIQKLYELCEIRLNDFRVVIATSLSLLTNEMIAWASPRQVEFSMSLDGLKSVHDSNRILASDSSYNRAVTGADAIIRSIGVHRIGVVTTVTKETLSSPEDLIQSHLNLGLSSFFIRPLSPYGFARKTSITHYELSEYFTFYREFLRCLKSLWKAGKIVSEHSIGVHVKRLLHPNFNSYADLKSPSGFGLNSILFNYDGYIFGSDEARMIQRLNPEIDFSIGHIRNENLSVSDLTSSIIDGGINYNKPGCAECAFQPFCGADPMQNISIFGEPVGNKSKSPFCEYHKGMFNIALEYLHGTDDNKNFIMDLAQ